MDLTKLTKVAVNAAIAAGKIIQKHMNDDFVVEKKQGGSNYASQIVTAIDKACEEEILSYILPTCEEYNLALLSEEIEDDGNRFIKDFFWCVDPMDGTLAFVEKRPGFTVSIALVSRDGTPYIGVVFDPSTDTLYQAAKGKGVLKNGKPWRIKNTNTHLTYITDRKLEDSSRNSEIKDLLKEIGKRLNLKEIKEISGAGAVKNAILVLENGPACMVKFPKNEKGGGSTWDFAATACIYEELGLLATNFDGGRLDLNKNEGAFMNHEGVFYRNWKI